jgi:hypothetical protein
MNVSIRSLAATVSAMNVTWLFCATLFAGLLGEAAELRPPEPFAAIARFHTSAAYAWSNHVETPGAPFQVPGFTGQIGRDGVAVRRGLVGGQPAVVVSSSTRVVVGFGSSWAPLTNAIVERPKAFADLIELSESAEPAHELQALATGLTNVTALETGLWKADLAPKDTESIMSGLLQRRAPQRSLKISSPQGTLRVWVKAGAVERYEVSTTGVISLPFGKKSLTRICTVTIADGEPAPPEIPAAAREALSKVSP